MVRPETRSESFFPNFSAFFSNNFSKFYIFLIFSPYGWRKFNEVDLFASGIFSRIVTERLRILIYISPFFFQTLEIVEKPLSDKNEPKRAQGYCRTKFIPGIQWCVNIQYGPANKKHLIWTSLRFMLRRHLQATLSIGYYIPGTW